MNKEMFSSINYKSVAKMALIGATEGGVIGSAFTIATGGASLPAGIIAGAATGAGAEVARQKIQAEPMQEPVKTAQSKPVAEPVTA